MLHEIKPYKFKIEYKNITPSDTDTVLVYKKGQILCAHTDGQGLHFPEYAELKTDEVIYLFAIDDMKFFAYTGDIEISVVGYSYVTFRDIRPMKPQHMAYAGAVGMQLWSWMKQNRFCGCCGGKRQPDEKERAMRCTSCGHIIYPSIPPSVIVGVRNGEKFLLTKYQPAHSPYQQYAVVAGYVETGETPEEAVEREVFEEVGLRVKNITYYASQPWPFSGALLLGYICDLDGDDKITLEQNELREAVWMDRNDLPDRTADVSLTSDIIQAFKDGRI